MFASCRDLTAPSGKFHLNLTAGPNSHTLSCKYKSTLLCIWLTLSAYICIVLVMPEQVVDERMWGEEDKPEPDQDSRQEQRGKDAPAQVHSCVEVWVPAQ